MSTRDSSRRSPRRKKGRGAQAKARRRLKSSSSEACERRLRALGRGDAPAEPDPEAAAAILLARARPRLDPPAESSGAKRRAEPAAVALKPEEKELRRKRARLSVFEGELARQELQLANLRADLLPFEARYYRRIGIRCARLDRIEAQIATIEARLHREDEAAQEAARRARVRAEESWAAVRRKLSENQFDPPAPLKRLYRSVARRIHPDFGEDATDCDLRARLMAHANRAYRLSDERRLRAIVSEYEWGPEVVRGEGTPLELVRVIRKIAVVRGRLSEIDDELEQARVSDLYRFQKRAAAAANEGRDLFAEVVAALNSRIAKARQQRDRLAATAKQSGAGAGQAADSRKARVAAFAQGCGAE